MWPPTQSLLLAHRCRKSATGAAIEPKTSKNLPTDVFLPGRPGLRQHLGTVGCPSEIHGREQLPRGLSGNQLLHFGRLMFHQRPKGT